MMTDFREKVGRSILTNPDWFVGMEAPLERLAVEEMERRLQLRLPEDFCAFLITFGAGYFGKINVFSARPESEWYLPARNPHILPQGFVAISDDEAGGFYGFLHDANKCQPDVYYLYPDEANGPQQVATTFNDYVVQIGLP